MKLRHQLVTLSLGLSLLLFLILGSLLAHYLALPLKEVLRIPQHYGCRAFIPEW